MLFADGAAAKVKDNRELFWFTIGCTFLFGLLAHGYSYFNIMYSHDSMMVYQDDEYLLQQLSVGRFMAPLYMWFRGIFYTPSLVAVLSLLFLGIAVYHMLRLFQIEKKLFVALICGMLTTCTTITLLYTTYMHDVDRYMFSFLLAVLGVVVIRRWRLGALIGALLICASLGLYQSYFQAAVLLVMMLAMMDALNGVAFQNILKFGLKGLAAFIGGLALYYIAAQIVPMLLGMDIMDNYNSLSNVGNYGGIDDILLLIGGTYQYVFDYFLHPVTAHSTLAGLMNILLGAALLAMLLYIAVVRKISAANLVLLSLLLVLMPFGMNVTYFISHGFEHNLMIFSFFILYAFFLIVFEALLKSIPENESCPLCRRDCYIPHCVVAAVFIWLLLGNIIYANQMYLQKELEYQNTLLTVNRIVDRIEQTEGYVPGETPVALVGTLQHSALSVTRPEYFDKQSVGNSQNFSVTYYESYEDYFEKLLNYPVLLLDEKSSGEWAASPAVQSMPSFPAMDSCKMIDGTLVVKLSE